MTESPVRHNPMTKRHRAATGTWSKRPALVVEPIADGALLDVDAVALEEDTFLVLSADPTPHETHENTESLVRQVSTFEAQPPGRVLVTGKKPLQFLAIVHDFNQEPTCREKWVASALREIFHQAERHGTRRLALPMLGTVHGSLTPRRFVDLFEAALAESNSEHLERIWVVVPDGTGGEVLERLGRIQLGSS